MIDIILYAFGVMYTPGPVNAICLNSGVQRQKAIVGFCLGVSAAMFTIFCIVSLVGERIVNQTLLQWTAILGGAYILWLAYKVFFSTVSSEMGANQQSLSTRDGFMLQMLNPKGLTVALPIATAQFPSAGITGGYIFVWCTILAILAFGAPLVYFVIGRLVGRNISQTGVLNLVNKLMALLLLFVGLNMAIRPVLELIRSCGLIMG